MPSSQPLAPELIARIKHLASQGLNNTEIGREVGLCRGTVRRYRDWEEPDTPTRGTPAESSEQTQDGWKINLDKTRIHTLDELIKAFNIDTEVWTPERFVANKWEMGYKDKEGDAHTVPLYQVKAFFKRNREVDFARQAIDRLIERIGKAKPVRIPAATVKTGNAAELSVVDFHDGALIWGKETGGANWDLKIANKVWRDAFSALIQRTRSFRPEKILLLLGNDQQNSDNKAGNTEAGTPQNNDGQYEKVFDANLDNSIWAIDRCREETPEVVIILVPGNHDRLTTYLLGKVLQAHYRDAKGVTIDNSPRQRKYYEHGINMLLFTHGDKGKLENYGQTMAAEQPEMWGRCKWREAHTGHRHQRRLIEQGGATVRVLPSLRPPCAWSAENHYVGSIRAAEAYIWNKAEGLIGTACYSILRESRQ